MLYMVACAFTNPARADAWNAWYNGPKIAALLTLPRYHGAQRFKALEPADPAPYLAVHHIDGPEMFETPAYRAGGGGGFAEWQDDIDNWSRDLFSGLAMLDEVPDDGLLALIDDPAVTEIAPGIAPIWLDSAGLDRTVPRRGLAILPAGVAASPRARAYRPISPRIT